MNFVWLSVASCVVSPARADVTLYAEDLFPVNYLDRGQPAGIASALVAEIQNRVGDHSKVQFVPWNRSYLELQATPNVALFSVSRKPEREKLFKWVCPLISSYWVLVKKRGSPLKLSSLEDAKNIHALGVATDGQALTVAKRNGLSGNIVEIGDVKTAKQKLISGEIDLWFADEEDLSVQRNDAGAFEIVYFVQKQGDFCLAFSSQTPDALVNQWQEGLRAMQKDGTYDAITFRFGDMPSTLMPPTPSD